MEMGMGMEMGMEMEMEMEMEGEHALLCAPQARARQLGAVRGA